MKSAASYALGYLSLGNLQKYIPFILHEIDTNSKRQYLLFNSLKEIISYQSSNPNGLQTIKPYITGIWDTLIKHCECSEEGTRNVVAECLGKLTLLNPETLMNNLQSYLECSSSLSRSTVVTAIKFTITDQVIYFNSVMLSLSADNIKADGISLFSFFLLLSLKLSMSY